MDPQALASLPPTMREKIEAVKRELRLANDDRVSASEVDALMRRAGLSLRPELMRYIFCVLEGGVDANQGVFDGQALWRFAEMFPALLDSLYKRLLDIEADEAQRNAIQMENDELNKLSLTHDHIVATIDRTQKAQGASKASLDSCEEHIEAAIEREKSAQDEVQEVLEEKEGCALEVAAQTEGVERQRGEELRRTRAVQEAQRLHREAVNERQRTAREADEAALQVESLERQLERAKEELTRRYNVATSAEQQVQAAKAREEAASADLHDMEEPQVEASEALAAAEKELFRLQALIKKLQGAAAQLANETENQRRLRDAARDEYSHARDAVIAYGEELRLVDAQMRQKQRTIDTMEARNEEWRRKRKAVAEEDLAMLEKEITLRSERKDMEDEESDFRKRVADLSNAPSRRAAFAELNVNHDTRARDPRTHGGKAAVTPPRKLSLAQAGPAPGRAGHSAGGDVGGEGTHRVPDVSLYSQLTSPYRPGEAGLCHPLDVAALEEVEGRGSGGAVQVGRSGNSTPVVVVHSKGLHAHSRTRSPERIPDAAIKGDSWHGVAPGHHQTLDMEQQHQQHHGAHAGRHSQRSGKCMSPERHAGQPSVQAEQRQHLAERRGRREEEVVGGGAAPHRMEQHHAHRQHHHHHAQQQQQRQQQRGGHGVQHHDQAHAQQDGAQHPVGGGPSAGSARGEGRVVSPARPVHPQRQDRGASFVTTVPIDVTSSSPPPEPNPLHLLSEAATGSVQQAGGVRGHGSTVRTTAIAAGDGLPEEPQRDEGMHRGGESIHSAHSHPDLLHMGADDAMRDARGSFPSSYDGGCGAFPGSGVGDGGSQSQVATARPGSAGDYAGEQRTATACSSEWALVPMQAQQRGGTPPRLSPPRGGPGGAAAVEAAAAAAAAAAAQEGFVAGDGGDLRPQGMLLPPARVPSSLSPRLRELQLSLSPKRPASFPSGTPGARCADGPAAPCHSPRPVPHMAEDTRHHHRSHRRHSGLEEHQADHSHHRQQQQQQHHDLSHLSPPRSSGMLGGHRRSATPSGWDRGCSGGGAPPPAPPAPGTPGAGGASVMDIRRRYFRVDAAPEEPQHRHHRRDSSAHSERAAETGGGRESPRVSPPRNTAATAAAASAAAGLPHYAQGGGGDPLRYVSPRGDLLHGDSGSQQRLVEAAKAEVAARMAAAHPSTFLQDLPGGAAGGYAARMGSGSGSVSRKAPARTPPPVVMYNKPSKYQVAMQARKRDRQEQQRQREQDEQRRQSSRAASRRRMPRLVDPPCYLRSSSDGSKSVTPRRVQVNL